VQGREVRLAHLTFGCLVRCVIFACDHLARFLKNFSGHNSPINALAVNEDGVAVSCGDNGSLSFWDYETGYCFQKSNTIVQPGTHLQPSMC
jgi:WD40 repeat protein